MNEPGVGNRHTIQVVANRTGLSPDVIRAWERRYQAVEPGRTPTGRRRYSDEDVRRLRTLKIATLAGRRIGEIARMPIDQLLSLVEEDSRAMPPERGDSGVREAKAYLERSIAAATSLDARSLEAELNRAAMELEIETVFEQVLTPLLQAIGERWLAGRLSIAHEHMTTSVVRALLDSIRTAFTNPSAACRVIATAPAGQHHELGAMKAAVIAAIEGWQATYLGCDLPAREIAAAATELDAHAIALSLVYPERDPRVESELRLLGRLLPDGVRLFVGGESARHYRTILEQIGGVLCSDMREFRHELRRIGGSTGAGPSSSRARVPGARRG